MKILVINAGSSSLKYQLIDMETEAVLAKGLCERIGIDGHLKHTPLVEGKEVFNEIGCANCHRPTWNTGDDIYWIPGLIGERNLPRYPHQTIHPYSDMIQHKLYMKNDIHGSWCRTTPLWGRGLSLINTGAEDRLHDCRARNEIEAIMWHGYSKNSHAYNSALKFYNLPKAERDAVVKFLRSI